MERLSLATICDKTAVERFDYELQKVLDNIIDPNTEATAAREITLTVKIKPDENREMIHTEMTVKSKMAGLTSVVSMGIIGKDIRGNAEAHEYPRPKQQDLPNFNNVKPIKKEIVND